MKIAIGSDHAGYELKEQVKEYLLESNYEVEDLGTHSLDSVDYPDYGKAVARNVVDNKSDFGIVVCGSGIGISIAANKVEGARCALCNEPLSAELSRLHNNANILSLGGRLIGLEMAKKI
ncbi:MAG: ribose 5-phosphate isomerase B, partial [Tissierellia bacterium]|nr:ribose 5-phosphate isomerase B [Tissierellia bacterium]